MVDLPTPPFPDATAIIFLIPGILLPLIFGASSSIEEYYQQIGRAGRDHLPAETILFYEKQKLVVSIQLAKKNTIDPDLLKIKKANLSKMMEYCEFPGCRRRFILEYFQEGVLILG